LLKSLRRLPSAAEAVMENRAFIAAVNRCAAQSKDKVEFFSTLFFSALC
jgi:hypothetical protein